MTDPSLPQDPGCLGQNAPHGPQPAGLVTMRHTSNLIDALAGVTPILGVKLVCPLLGYGYTGTLGANGDCQVVSKPGMVNNVFWHNRSFSVDIISLGSGNQSQQNLIALTPALNQTSTGDCSTGTVSLPGSFYYDIGLRTDDVTSGVLTTTGNKLSLLNSILTQDYQGVITASASNKVATNPAFVAPYCNGARIPPENCAAQGSQTTIASCKGYNTPVGASETTSTSQLFAFNGIQPTATVDEGHNWLNLSYGPLTLSRPTVAAATPGEKLVGNASVGLAGGAYSIPGTSPAVGGGLATVPLIGRVAPDHDYFGSARGASVDIGAVQFVSAVTPPPPPPAIPALTPALDNFNRANANTLGANWSQPTLLGFAAIRLNTNQANANLAGAAYWNVPTAGFGAKQAAAFTISNGTFTGDALVLKATGGTATIPGTFIRVRIAAGSVIVETTTNSGLSYTTRGTVAATFANGDTLTALADATGAVYVWKTTGATTTYLGTRGDDVHRRRPHRDATADRRAGRQLRRWHRALSRRQRHAGAGASGRPCMSSQRQRTAT